TARSRWRSPTVTARPTSRATNVAASKGRASRTTAAPATSARCRTNARAEPAGARLDSGPHLDHRRVPRLVLRRGLLLLGDLAQDLRPGHRVLHEAVEQRHQRRDVEALAGAGPAQHQPMADRVEREQ